MCGRFAFTSPVEAVADFFKADASRIGPTEPNTNVCPTQDIVTLVAFEKERILTPMRWGFIPHWYQSHNDGPLLINARAETINEKPAFRDAFQHRRCIIPVDYYYEWSAKNDENKKAKYSICDLNGEMLACAGIWQAWRDAEGQRKVTCAMITVAANDTISSVHHRMPLMIPTQDIDDWLMPSKKESLILPEKINTQNFKISMTK